VITAREGSYTEETWHLLAGVRRVLDEDGYVLQETGFDRLDIPVQDSEKLFGEQKTTDEMTRRELGDHVRLFQKSGIDVQRFVVDYHLKLALPLAAVIWVLVAAPMVWWSALLWRLATTWQWASSVRLGAIAPSHQCWPHGAPTCFFL
jgi:lipopolysaccharide export LptBFGC system permease protein LptF